MAAAAPDAHADGVVPARIFNDSFDFAPIPQSSYANFKQIGLSTVTGGEDQTARAYGHFLSPGQLDIFVGSTGYDTNLPPEQATPSKFWFYVYQPQGYWAIYDYVVTSPDGCVPVSSPGGPQFCGAIGCVHARKALTADFNADGAPDVFVACHGYDAPPFPGEKNKVVLSRPGGWLVQDASSDVGFFHGASGANLNGDHYPDVVVADARDPEQLYALINDGFGHFTREPNQRFPTLAPGYFSVELMDVDGDGLLDLVVGGHEHDGAATLVFLNPGDSDFRAAAPTTIPAVPGHGTVLDFTLTSAQGQRTLWISRTSPGYGSRVVQKVAWPGLASSTPLLEDPGRWVRWLIPGVLPNGDHYVMPDSAFDGMFQLVQ